MAIPAEAQATPIHDATTPTEDVATPTKEVESTTRVAVIGAPNAGKSTLVNCLLGQKVFAVSPKVHTTSRKALGVFTQGLCQVVRGPQCRAGCYNDVIVTRYDVTISPPPAPDSARHSRDSASSLWPPTWVVQGLSL